MKSLFVPFLIILVGCAKKITADGFTVSEKRYHYMESQVLNTAKFDMSCEDVTLTILTMNGPYLRTVGASGCGQRRVYIKIPETSQWLANSGSSEETE